MGQRAGCLCGYRNHAYLSPQRPPLPSLPHQADGGAGHACGMHSTRAQNKNGASRKQCPLCCFQAPGEILGTSRRGTKVSNSDSSPSLVVPSVLLPYYFSYRTAKRPSQSLRVEIEESRAQRHSAPPQSCSSSSSSSSSSSRTALSRVSCPSLRISCPKQEDQLLSRSYIESGWLGRGSWGAWVPAIYDNTDGRGVFL